MSHSHTPADPSTAVSPFLCACPACGYQAEVAGFLMQAEFADVVKQCFDLQGENGRTMLAYISLFKPKKQRMTIGKTHAALAELVPLMVAGAFSRNATRYTVPRDAWAVGMAAVLSQRTTLTLPLAGHGYLLTIMQRTIDQAGERVAVAAEARVETQRKVRVINDNPQQPAHTLPPPEVAAMINKITRSKTV